MPGPSGRRFDRARSHLERLTTFHPPRPAHLQTIARISDSLTISSQDGKAVVEFAFAAATVEGLFLGESKKNDCLADSAKGTPTEFNKLLNGCRALGATHLVPVTPRNAWKQATIDKQLQGDAARGVSAPKYSS
ncbi:hypothetical protein ACWGR4_30810 [Embleya sp. NPDC055664]